MLINEGIKLLKIISIYIISVFLLTSFTGCTKFRETINGSHNQFDINQSGKNQSDIQQEETQLNEQQPLNPDASAASSDTSVDTTTSDASASDASTAAQTVNNEESWSEWTSRQWNKSSTKWISGTVAAVVVVAAGVVIYRNLWPKKEEPQPPQVDNQNLNNPENNIQNDAEIQPKQDQQQPIIDQPGANDVEVGDDIMRLEEEIANQQAVIDNYNADHQNDNILAEIDAGVQHDLEIAVEHYVHDEPFHFIPQNNHEPEHHNFHPAANHNHFL